MPGMEQPDILSQIWASEASDLEPSVAATRHLELKNLTQSTKFSRQPEAWKTPVRAEYLKMQQAAQVATIPGLQKQIQDLTAQGQQSAQALQKEQAKPNLSFTMALTPADAVQSQSILQQVDGITIPPSSGSLPSGDQALQQVGELHQGVSTAIQQLHQKIDQAAQQKAKESTNGKAGPPPLTIVNPTQETAQAIEHLSEHIKGADAKHQADLGAVGQQLEQVKQLAANTAIHVQQNPQAVVATKYIRGPDQKISEIHQHHRDGSVTKHKVQRDRGRPVGTVAE
jgi:uncharacterized protein YihD (DUF1040 family)